MQLLKSGEKQFQQFLVICLQDLCDQSKAIVETGMKTNPFSVVVMANIGQIIGQSIVKKKAKKVLIKNGFAKKMDFRDYKSQYYCDVFNNLKLNALKSF